jgi:hypothetical protein
MILSRGLLAWAVVLALLALVLACGNGGRLSIGDDCEAGFCGVQAVAKFPPPPAADGGDAADGSPPLMCVATACPAPYATCESPPSFPCQTNLQNDTDNCGACGVSCAGFEAINLGSRCVKGACAFECLTKADAVGTPHEFRDCNSLLDDGCEIDISTDPTNCGACGNACQAGQHCIHGKCGCFDGKTDCNGYCTDTRYDDYNCGGCGTDCVLPAAACSPLPPNTNYGCVQSACGKLKCVSGFADCNQDLNLGCASDGCETDLGVNPDNCGGCGIKCGVGQECRDDGNGPQCLVTCANAGRTQCAGGCADLLSDGFNCGACGTHCMLPGDNQISSCKKGLCTLECAPGFADCNGVRSDGCEIDLKVHPANCGACGNRCDSAAGQPCIEGKCVMVECEAGVSQ